MTTLSEAGLVDLINKYLWKNDDKCPTCGRHKKDPKHLESLEKGGCDPMAYSTASAGAPTASGFQGGGGFAGGGGGGTGESWGEE